MAWALTEVINLLQTQYCSSIMINSVDTYKQFSEFYDLYVGKFSDDLDFYKTFCSKSDKIIEIGCGTGRILEFFLQQDYSIVGVDVSQEMLDKAAIKLSKWIAAKKLTLINHDFTSGMINASFDKALLTFYTFNYIIEKPVDFLRYIHESLNDNGLLLMDLFYPVTLLDKTIQDKWVLKEFSIEGMKVKIKDNRRVVNNIERRQQIFCINDSEIKIDTDRKYYSPAEMLEFLQLAGFKDVKFALGYSYSNFAGFISENDLKVNYIIKAQK